MDIQRYVRELDVSENKQARQFLLRFPVESLVDTYAFKAAANLTAAQYAAAGVSYCDQREFLEAVDRTMQSFARTPWVRSSLAQCRVRHGDLAPRDDDTVPF
jgi:hypothetical protein